MTYINQDVLFFFDKHQTAFSLVEGYKASLVKDTSRKGLWTVSFTLREF